MTPGDSDAPGSAPRALAKTNPTKGKVTRDLDQARAILASPPDVLARIFEIVDALARHRKIDPELRVDILRVAEHVAPGLVEQLECELDIATPAAVLEAHQAELIEDKPTLGAFPSPDKMSAPSVEQWFVEDPKRLRGLVLESYRFGGDEKLIVEAAVGFAYRLGIDLRLATDVVRHALIDARARHDEAVAR